MASPLTVAVVQLTSTDDVARNLDAATKWVRAAAEAGARLVALPENFGFLARDADKLQHAQSVEASTHLAPMRDLARELQIHILAGSIPETGPDAQRTYNTSVLLGTDGATRAVYRKIHLFDVDLGDIKLEESASVASGDELVVVDVEGWALGLTVCYDLRFPELYRRLVEKGAQVLMVPAAFTLHTGKDHWDVLLRARAIENQCYVVAPNQFGFHGGKRSSWGKSQIIDPWGIQLGVAPETEGFALGVLDEAIQHEVRRKLPCLQHRQDWLSAN